MGQKTKFVEFFFKLVISKLSIKFGHEFYYGDDEVIAQAKISMDKYIHAMLRFCF